ncbi:heterokaryon incompatibility protein-domain-containing protein [Hypoxylon cercidicola]|nr:heterokaryon incompatibility protein-domain-containing protein [Hypoxylon cercidicola]
MPGLESRTTYLTTVVIVVVTLSFAWKISRGKTPKLDIPQPKITPTRNFGLTQLHPDPEQPAEDDNEIIDIVAIHGLGTQSATTWAAWKVDGDPKSGKVHWLKDPHMLPSELTKSRIFTYDWLADVGPHSSLTSIFHHALQLLSSLNITRNNTKTETRPIIFVASCFGGLILAKALVEASQQWEEKRYGAIVRSTVGVAFLGTPFQGTDKFLHDATLLRIVAAAEDGAESSEGLVRYLRHDAERGELDELVHKFVMLKDNPRYKFPVVCFYEQLQTDLKSVLERLPPDVAKRLDTRGSRVLVKPHSACLPGVDPEPLPVRHKMLNKFNSPANDGFEKLCYRLKEFAKSAGKVLEEKVNHRESSRPSQVIAEWLATYDFSSEQRLFSSQSQEGTGEWFLKSHEFQNWLGEEGAVLYCPGISGTGKTTLASIVIRHLREKFRQQRHVTVACIYCIDEKQEEQTADSLLRCVLRQIVQGRHDVHESVQCLYKDFAQSMSRPTIENLSETLSSLIKGGLLKLFVIIDALDECPSYERDQLLKEMFRLQKDCKARILVTAQPIPGIEKRFSQSTRLEIAPPQQEIQNYIEVAAKKVLEPEFTNDKALMDEIMYTIAKAADGMFLLARLYLNSLDSPRPRETLRSLQALDPMATRNTEEGRKRELEQAYNKVVKRIRRRPEHAKFAKEVLSWILVARRPLTIKELQHALVLEPSKIPVDKWQLIHPSTIASTCGGLVVVEQSTNTIRLVHSTARLFLEDNLYRVFESEGVIMADSSTEAIRTFNIDANRRISLACIAYLRIDKFKTPLLTLEQWHARLESYPFYDYAADYWEHHVDAGLMRENQHVLAFREDKLAVAAMCPIFPPTELGPYFTPGDEILAIYGEFAQHMLEWVEDCGTCHGSCNDIGGISQNPQRLIRLIDTRRMCIVTVPRPRGMRYAVLSYLWGNYQETVLTTENIHQLTTPHGLAHAPLPKSILEAISLCQYIHYRYLWVDVLCIVQDDMKDWQYQALRTGEVFIHANITIVAACGSSSRSGIFTLSERAKSSEEVFSIKPDADRFRQVMSETSWDKRGWTFQEKILSRCLLIFTLEGPYFSCGSHLYSPGGSIATTPERIGRPLSLDKVECGRQLEMYLEIVQAFSMRQFAVARDIAFAMHAITSPLGSTLDGKPNTFLWGIPTCAMDELLCWRVEKHDPDARRHEYPSWSWYGWKQMPQFPLAVISLLQKSSEMKNHQITRCVPGESLGLDWTDSQWGVMCLCLATPRRTLRVDMEYKQSVGSTNGLYQVRLMRKSNTVGHIQFDRRWRQYEPSTMHFIPVFTALGDDKSIRIKMLMCMNPVSADSRNEVFERVQIMDCDISETEWREMENKGGSNNHIWLT